MTLRQDLERLLDEHRQSRDVHEITCFCWEIAELLRKSDDDGFAVRRFVTSEHQHLELLVPILRESQLAAIKDETSIPHVFDVLVYRYNGRVSEKEYQYEFQGLRSGK